MDSPKLAPQNTVRRFFLSQHGIGVSIQMILPIAAFVRELNRAEPDRLWIIPGLAVAVSSLLVVKEVVAFRTSNQPDKSALLDGCLFTLHRLLMWNRGQESDKDDVLRICVHEKINESWVQVTDYVGPKKRRGKGRRADISKGVVGLAFRNKETTIAKCRSRDERITQLITSFGYTEEEARGIRTDAMCWVAIPIGEPENFYAVVFLDVNSFDFFGRQDSFRMKTLQECVVSIASLLDAHNL